MIGSYFLEFGVYFLTIGVYLLATDGCIFVLLHISSCYGWAKPETNMINTGVAKKDLLAIQSLLDSILLNLKCTNSPNTIGIVLTCIARGPTAEILYIRTQEIYFSRTPIGVISKTAKPLLV